MVYGTYNYTYWGESKPTYNWGAHCKDHLGIMRLCFVSGYQAAKERGMSFTEFWYNYSVVECSVVECNVVECSCAVVVVV